MADKANSNQEPEDQFTLIRIRVSTKKRLKTICPKGLQFQFFASDFVDNAIDHREVLKQVAAEIEA